ncbi:MAG: TIGR03960 family B12-binding radical SAM protein [Halanaerobiaceae bacterium]
MNLNDKLDKLLYRVSRPERYIGNEWNQIKKEWTADKIKVLLAFPDVYEIGMSHLGLKILYHILNQNQDIICERVFAPWFDMEKLMKKESISLHSLENRKPAAEFDIIGFTLQYEMSYTNILNMLSLAEVPLYSNKRGRDDPLIIGGGSIVYNPEPIAPFFDLIFIGEAESEIENLVRTYWRYQNENMSRGETLIKLNQLPGVYVPSLYKVEYNNSGKIREIQPDSRDIKEEVKKQLVEDLDQSFFPTNPIVPYMDIVHDRAVVEIARGCTRGCRFCVAGMHYRPVRERTKDNIISLADRILNSTGYDEISLNSLSTIDNSRVTEIAGELAEKYKNRNISVSLSSLRVDQFSVNIAREVQKVRKSGLTFAPEAGTQRLRNVINKGVDEKEFFRAAEAAFSAGWHRIKLYFMIGLPTETEEDIKGIVKSVKRIQEIGRKIRQRKNNPGKPISIHVSISTFIPKPFTPFQWVKMADRDEIAVRQEYLQENLRGRGLQLSWDNYQLSSLEAAFSRGDRRLATVIESAWKKGARFDGWDEYFDYDIWKEAITENNLSLDLFNRSRSLEETFPWEHINIGVGKEFLQKEYAKAHQQQLTPDCRFDICPNCGVCSELNVENRLAGDGEFADQS